MSAAPKNRARSTRFNGQPKVGSTSLSSVRVKREVSMAEETSMAQVLLLMQQQQMTTQQRTHVGANGGSAAAGSAGSDRCGVSATRSEAVSNEGRF